jgi:ABC-type sulfate transport system permease component
MDQNSMPVDSPLHWLVIFGVVIVFNVLLFFWPLSKILKKMGYSRWSALWAFVPFGVFFGLWILANRTWPVERRTHADS